MSNAPVPAENYTEEYYLQRCGGVEFFRAYGSSVLKPSMQAAVQAAGLKPGHRVLDIGCGRGEVTDHLTGKGFDAVGIDYAPEAVETARRSFPKAKFECVDLTKASFPEASFDRIFCLATIEHLTDEQITTLFTQTERLLKPGGLFVVTTCTNRFYYKAWTYRLRDALAVLLRALGAPLRRPSPPRSDEDQSLHINEQDLFSLKAWARRLGWTCRVEPRPNPKLATEALYGPALPAGFPLSPKAAWKQRFYRRFLFRLPVSLLLARQYLAVFSRGGAAS